jgi:hypothetical protein
VLSLFPLSFLIASLLQLVVVCQVPLPSSFFTPRIAGVEAEDEVGAQREEQV